MFSWDTRLKNGIIWISMFFICATYIVIASFDVLLAAVFCLTMAGIVLFYYHTDLSFIAFLLILPFCGMNFFNQSILGIPGLRPQYILVLLIFVLFIVKRKAEPLSAEIAIFFAGTLVLFIIGYIRSVDYASLLFDKYTTFSVYSYASIQLIMPLIILLPLIMIPMFYRNNEQTGIIIRTMIFSTVTISLIVLYAYLFLETQKPNLEHFRETLSSFLGLHGNDLANFCFLSIPLIIAYCFRHKTVFSYATLLLALVMTVLSYSRTAYFIVLFGIILFFVITSRFKYLPLVCAVIAVIVLFALPQSVIERAVTGFEDADLNVISAGRVQYIWEPIIEEIEDKTEVILFGYGLHGIVNTKAYQNGTIFSVGHAHNMYLDMVLESGLVGLLFFLFFYLKMLHTFIMNLIRRELDAWNRDILAAVIVAVVCYIIGGFTGRRLFPSLTNIYFWILIGLGYSIVLQNKALDIKTRLFGVKG